MGDWWRRYVSGPERECWWCGHLPGWLIGWHWRLVELRMPDDEPGDEDWPDEPPETWVDDLPPERPIELVPLPPMVDLSDDPDLVVWDARQQWQRCWEIVHVEFPRLRAELVSEGAMAA